MLAQVAQTGEAMTPKATADLHLSRPLCQWLSGSVHLIVQVLGRMEGGATLPYKVVVEVVQDQGLLHEELWWKVGGSAARLSVRQLLVLIETESVSGSGTHTAGMMQSATARLCGTGKAGTACRIVLMYTAMIDTLLLQQLGGYLPKPALHGKMHTEPGKMLASEWYMPVLQFEWRS